MAKSINDILINKLHEYIMENNPEVLLQLQEEDSVTEYLKAKVGVVSDHITYLIKIKSPDYVIEELCMRILTKDLRPSKFNYISSLLQEDFEATYQQLQNSGTLRYEVINLIDACKPVFDSFGFTEENEDNRQLRYGVTGCINEYFTKNQ